MKRWSVLVNGDPPTARHLRTVLAPDERSALARARELLDEHQDVVHATRFTAESISVEENVDSLPAS
jgi:hypothetical protein